MSDALPEACKRQLITGIEQLELSLSDEVIDRLLEYLALLVKWNKAYNLTAVRDPVEMVHRHLLDSLSLLPYLDNKRMLDVGTGAGIPGLIIAIVKPDQPITLLDSNGKKTRFLQNVKMQMGLNQVEVIQSRVENYSPEHLFDRIISRAFTALDNMVNWCQHLLTEDGAFLAMKGTYPEPNQKPLPPGWSVRNIQKIEVPFVNEERHLVTIDRS